MLWQSSTKIGQNEVKHFQRNLINTKSWKQVKKDDLKNISCNKQRLN